MCSSFMHLSHPCGNRTAFVSDAAIHVFESGSRRLSRFLVIGQSGVHETYIFLELTIGSRLCLKERIHDTHFQHTVFFALVQRRTFLSTVPMVDEPRFGASHTDIG